MVVSPGFERKIRQWLFNNGRRDLQLRPFLTEGNPYRSKCFVVGIFPQKRLPINMGNLGRHVEALLHRELFSYLYGDLIESREKKGIDRFFSWYYKQFAHYPVWAFLNAIEFQDEEHYKLYRKLEPEAFQIGHSVFLEILEEFQPEHLILYGNKVLKEFRSQFSEVLIDSRSTIEKCSELVELGAFAKMYYDNGKMVKIYAVPSISLFAEEQKQFQKLLHHLMVEHVEI